MRASLPIARTLRSLPPLRACSTEAGRLVRSTGGGSGNHRNMARGTRNTRGTGQSLVGSNNQYGARPGQFTSEVELEGSDMLVEVLAEEYRHKRSLEFLDEELSLQEVLEQAESDGEGKASSSSPPPPKGPYMQHRKYLTHRGVGDGTVFKREAMAAQARVDAAQETTFLYRLPAQFRAQRDALEQQRKHGGNLVEEAIVRAIADGHFDKLAGKGKRLPDESDPFEDPGTRAFNKVLRRAGCAPRWVEENRDIRRELLLQRLYLAGRWAALRAASVALAASTAEATGAGNVSPSPRSGMRGIFNVSRASTPAAPLDAFRARERAAEAAWHEEVRRFTDKAAELNKRVKNYNLMAPTAASFLSPVDVPQEVRHVESGQTAYDPDLLRDLSDDSSTWRIRGMPAGSAQVPEAAGRGGLEWAGVQTGLHGIAVEPVPADIFSFTWREMFGLGHR